jgi:hypothetical protein
MINPSELRIGNSIITEHHESGRNEGVVAEINDRIITVQNKYLEGYAPKCCHPIPLTPEILEKAGFVKMEDHSFWNNQENDFYGTGREGVSFPIAYNEEYGYRKFFASEDDFYSWCGGKITSLHQLQNLYFALTGTELTINL